MTTPLPASRLSFRKRLLFAGVILLVFLGLAEVTLRCLFGSARLQYGYRFIVDTHLMDTPYSSFLRRQERIREARSRLGMERGRDHPVFGFIYNPTFQMDIPEEGIEIHINSFALRGEEFPEKKPPGEIRILCMGGSTTAGEEVRESKTYPAQLQCILSQHFPGRQIRVINAGIPSYDLRKSFQHYALRLYRLEPDFVTIYHGINDLGYHGYEIPQVLPKKNFSGRMLEPFVHEGDAVDLNLYWDLRPEVGRILTKLARRSQIFSLIDSLFAYRPPTGEGSLAAPNPDGIEMFRVYFNALVRHIQATGATPVPMTFAISYPGEFSVEEEKKIEASFQIWLKWPRASLKVGTEIMDAQNKAIFELCQKEHLTACDVASAIPKNKRNFVDVCHFTEDGNRLIAETLARTLVPLIDHVPPLSGH